MSKKVISLLFLLVIIFNTKSVHAEKVSLAITPVTTHIISKPGRTITLPVTLHNSGDPVTAKLVIRKLVPDTDGNLVSSIDSLDPFSFSLNNSQLLLNNPFLVSAKDSFETTLVMQVPEVAESKDYYYGLFFESEASPAPEGTATINLINSLASVITISVTQTGELNTDADIALFTVTPDLKLDLMGRQILLFDSKTSIPVKLFLKNTGSHLASIQGKIVLQKGSRKILSIPIENYSVVSETQKEVQIKDINTTPWGKFTLTLTIVDVNNHATHTASTVFYVLPLFLMKITTLLLCLVVLVAIFYIFRLYRKAK